MATIAAALLMGRLGRALVHAGAAAPAGGDAWLLAGDSGAGKSTTTAALAAAGWAWLADDHVVLAPEDAAVMVEGWPRRSSPASSASAPSLAGDLSPARWQRRARLGGVLLPVVRPERATALRPARPAEALAALVRQSPWLLADAAVAPVLLRLLQRAAQLPAFHLVLGRDCLRRPERLLCALAASGVGAA
jgi:hypothetical protein